MRFEGGKNEVKYRFNRKTKKKKKRLKKNPLKQKSRILLKQ